MTAEEYLLDTCIVLEIFQDNPKTKKWIKDNEDKVMYISGWTVLELLREKKSKLEMENSLKKLISKFQVLWNKPEFSDEIPELLIREFHMERDNQNNIKGNAIFDVCIYVTAKSNNNIAIVTRDNDFNFSKDVEILNLDNIEEYRRDNQQKTS